MIGLAIGLALAKPEPTTLAADLIGFAPLGIVVLLALVLLMTDAFARTREAGFQRPLALLGLGVAIIAAAREIGDPELDLGHFAAGGFLIRDHLTALADLLILIAGAGIVGLAREHGPPARTLRGFGEREPLILLASVGAMVCVHAGDLISAWLGLELLGMAGLVLLLASHDAGSSASKRALLVRQLVPALLGSTLLGFGVALIYAAIGTTSLEGFGREVTRVFAQWGGVQRWVLLLDRYGAEVAQTDPAMYRQAHAEIIRGMAPVALFLPAVLILLAALLAKLGLWPFVRRRELDEDAPLHVAALRSTVVVIAVTIVLLRVFVAGMHMPRMVNAPYGWTSALPSLALITGTLAVLVALRQRRLPRIVAGLGLLQVSLLVLGASVAANFQGHIGPGARAIAPSHEIMWSRLVGDETFAAVLTLLIAHTLALVGCYAAIAAGRGHLGPEVRMQHWAGMAARRPGLALAFSVCLLSLVGLPPLAGFVGKLALLRSIAEHSGMRWVIVVVAIQLAIAGWIALRVIAAMYFGDETVSEPGVRHEPGPWPARVAASAALLSLGLGVAGQRLIELTRLPAAGSSFEPGAEERIEWLEERRAAWAIEDARFEGGVEAVEDELDAGETGETGETETEGMMSVEPL
ncbi:proton-conducting transporter membrane subunit [Nannocystaceae bacterium ST9]